MGEVRSLAVPTALTPELVPLLACLVRMEPFPCKARHLAPSVQQGNIPWLVLAIAETVKMALHVKKESNLPVLLDFTRR